MNKIDKETKKAILKIPKEINRLSRVVACIGRILSNDEAQKLRQKQKDFEELLEKNERSDVT